MTKNAWARHRWLNLITIAFALTAVLGTGMYFRGSGLEAFGATETPSAIPLCPRLTETESTPSVAAGANTPVVSLFCEATGLGTPVTSNGVRVVLSAAQTDAGPVDLTVTLSNNQGKPIDGATVLILTQHLEMNHGVSTDSAEQISAGVYLAKRVSMGMGGHWQVEVQVRVPGKPIVAAVFEVKLNGPM
jgi:hypothetical protein